ncbi:MAG: hypothetical protein WC107_06500 [Patescibacteria group bacterium]
MHPAEYAPRTCLRPGRRIRSSVFSTAGAQSCLPTPVNQERPRKNAGQRLPKSRLHICYQIGDKVYVSRRSFPSTAAVQAVVAFLQAGFMAKTIQP